MAILAIYLFIGVVICLVAFFKGAIKTDRLFLAIPFVSLLWPLVLLVSRDFFRPAAKNTEKSNPEVRSEITTERVYDERGNLIKVIGKDAEGVIVSKVIKNYDEKNHLISEDVIGQTQGGEKWMRTFKYDITGKVIDDIRFFLKRSYKIEP